VSDTGRVSSPTPIAPDDLTSTLTDWFAVHARPLPWRSEAAVRAAGRGRADFAWGVFLSEVMSQQTPVARVEPVWRAWLHAWPTPGELAVAPTADVLRAWDRLGYPRPALRLREAAGVIERDHDGRVPADEDALLALPGVGAYTAAAVAAFAYGRRSVVLDTNVRRVLGRVTAGIALPRPHLRREEWHAAADLVPTDPATAARWNAAVMEFGALVCTAVAPACDACPLRRRGACAWHASGAPPDSFRRRRQTWAGSDRQARGRIMALLRTHAELSGERLAELVGATQQPEPVGSARPTDIAQHERALASLVADGLVAEAGGAYRLPS